MQGPLVGVLAAVAGAVLQQAYWTRDQTMTGDMSEAGGQAWPGIDPHSEDPASAPRNNGHSFQEDALLSQPSSW